MNDFSGFVIFYDLEKSILTYLNHFFFLSFLNVLFKVFLEVIALDIIDLSLQVSERIVEVLDFLALLESVFSFVEDLFVGFLFEEDFSVD